MDLLSFKFLASLQAAEKDFILLPLCQILDSSAPLSDSLDLIFHMENAATIIHARKINLCTAANAET